MRQQKRLKRVKRSLATALFCVSILIADIEAVMPVFAQERGQNSLEFSTGEILDEGDRVNGTAESEQIEENSDATDSGRLSEAGDVLGEEQKEGIGQVQDSVKEDSDREVQQPGEEQEKYEEQTPLQGEDSDEVSESNKEEDIEDSDVDEESEGNVNDEIADDEVEDSETSEAEEVPNAEETESVSENDLQEDSRMSALLENAPAIASGRYEDVIWVINADGKLTVEGNGEFAASPTVVSPYRAPWSEKASEIKTAQINVTGLTDASYMFYKCTNLTSVDLSRLDTDTIVNMEGMFHFCTKLESIDLSNFHTSQVTNMSDMFATCTNLRSIDVSGFDTSRVTDTSGMFSTCGKLEELNVSGFDTSRVENMAKMFSVCDSLTSLDVSGFNTSSVTDMSGMFAGNGLTSLDVSGFDTSNVTTMYSMFAGSSNLTSLDISNFDTSKVTNMNGMFSQCRSLTNLDLSNFDTSEVKATRQNTAVMEGMFSQCTNLTSLDLSSFDVTNVDSLRSMFSGCSNLRHLDLSNFNCINVTNAIQMFTSCDNLTSLYTPYNISSSVSITLPKAKDDDVWYRTLGGTSTEITTLPQELNYSILVMRNDMPDAETRLTAKKGKTQYACGEQVDLNDLIVTYYGSDGSVKKLAAGEYTTNIAEIDIFTPGEKTLIVTYEKGGVKLNAKVTLTMSCILSATTVSVVLPTEDKYDYTYSGQPKTPAPAVYYMRKNEDNTETSVLLLEGTDYSLTYQNNINAYEQLQSDMTDTGAAAFASSAAPTVSIKGTGSYSGTVIKNFMIKKASAPATETLDISASQCMQEKPDRMVDFSGCFAAYGEKLGYEIIAVKDEQSIFSRIPVTSDIRNGILTYGTNASRENDTVSITVRVSFVNYGDAELIVRITMTAKKAVTISGISMSKEFVYNGEAAGYDGTASVIGADGTDLTGKTELIYRYKGTMADGTSYPVIDKAENLDDDLGTEVAPVNAGRYILSVAVSEENPDYTGSVEYPFTIVPATAVVKAKDMTILVQENDAEQLPSYQYEVTGLMPGDMLIKEPIFAVTDVEGNPVTKIDRTKEGIYHIIPSGANAGMNYDLGYEKGVLTVTEERVTYSVRFDCMGHGDNFVKDGIKAGSLLNLSDFTAEERVPQAEGYLFAGWYKDRTFGKGKEWNFDEDTVQADITLYACWLTEGLESGNGLKLCVQEIPDLTYTGGAQKPAVTVYDSDGMTLLKAGKDYTIKYVRNSEAVAVEQDGSPVFAGGTAKVTNPGKVDEKITDVTGHFTKECPYVVITGKGNYAETIYRNFQILPTDISAGNTIENTNDSDNTQLAAGFTLKYMDQYEAKANKSAKIVSSFKYKKALKENRDFVVSVQNEAGEDVALNQGKLPLNTGTYTLTLSGKGNFTGTVKRNLYVAEKQKLMKNASVVYAKSVKAEGREALLKGIEQSDVKVKIAGREVSAYDYDIDYADTNHAIGTATMTLTGKNGYVGSKSVTFKIVGTTFDSKTVAVKAYDKNRPDENDWKSVMSYTGKAVTQNKVTLTTKVTQNNQTEKELAYGEDYTITYKNNIKRGTATMTFTANPKCGFSGSFKKSFKIGAQNLSAEMFEKELPNGEVEKRNLTIISKDESKNNTIVRWDEDAAYAKSGALLSFSLRNEEGIVLKQGKDYTITYKYNKAVTKENGDTSVTLAGRQQPLMIVKGKGNFTGTLTVQFQIIPASISSDVLKVTAAQAQKKDGINLKDFKLKVMDGKNVLKEGKDYVIDDTACTPEIIKAYADSLGTAVIVPEPKVILRGIGNYGLKAEGLRQISLGDYIYVSKLTTKNLKVEVTGSKIYTGQNIEPEVEVTYYVGGNAANPDAMGEKLTEGRDYRITYGSKNISAGKKKGSVTVTGAGIYGGSVAVKFDIEKKPIY